MQKRPQIFTKIKNVEALNYINFVKMFLKTEKRAFKSCKPEQ